MLQGTFYLNIVLFEESGADEVDDEPRDKAGLVVGENLPLRVRGVLKAVIEPPLVQVVLG